MPVTLVEFKKALNSLKQALELEKNDIVRDATIQRFEFPVVLAWKSAKKVMGTSTSAPKQVIREMGLVTAVNGRIADLRLFAMIPVWLLLHNF